MKVLIYQQLFFKAAETGKPFRNTHDFLSVWMWIKIYVCLR